MSEMKEEVLAEYASLASRRRFLSASTKVAAAGAVTMVALGQNTGSGNAMGNDLNVLNYALTLEFLEATFYTQFLGMGAPPSGSSSLTGLIGTVMGNPRAFTATDLASATGFSALPGPFGTGIFNLLTQIRDHEITHVAALIQTIRSLGGVPTQPCTYNFPVTDINSFLQTAQVLENAGVAAYDGAINMITSPALIQTGATIATVEARHAAFLNLIAGGGLTTGNFQPMPPSSGAPAGVPGVSPSPFPTAFDTPLTMAQVLAAAAPFLSSCPVPVQQTTVNVVVTPASSSTSPFTAGAVTLDLASSASGTGQPVAEYSFSVPANAAAFCPAAPTPGVGSMPAGPAACPLRPAILQARGSSRAIIQFVNGSGFYPVQVTVRDSAGRTSTQTVVLAYQASSGPTLPTGTPGLAVALPGAGGTTGGGMTSGNTTNP